MTAAATGFLVEKAALLRARAALAPSGAALDAIRHQATAQPARASFLGAMREGDTVSVIAEFKRRSPSAGELRGGGEGPGAVARSYEIAGARALSVLTDHEHFGGNLSDLGEAGATTRLPILRKDFVIDAAGVLDARMHGASAVLLIAAILEPREMRALMELSVEIGIDALVEAGTGRDVEIALDAGATLVGINNRDLATLTTALHRTERLAPLIPRGVTLVSESGIRDPADVARMRDAGAHAVLVGESLLRHDADARAELLRSLSAVSR